MRRDTLELADDSLFIERIKGRFVAADTDLLIRAHAFLSEKACAEDTTAHKAAALLIETVASARLPLPLWQACIDPSEIRELFGSTMDNRVEDLSSPLIPTTDDRHLRHRDIHAILPSIGGVPRKALLFITFRLLVLQKAIGSSGMRARKIAQDTLDRLLDNNGLRGRVQGRVKSLHGIRRKIARMGKPPQSIMDRVASVLECYTVQGLLHAHFNPIPGTVANYIGLPKDNGYQSLHTCVYPVCEVFHKPIEFQVRTELMHMEAEHGAATHWRYKSRTAAEACDQYKTRWMQGLVRQHATADSPDAFIRLLHRQVFQGHVEVFGSGGRIVRLDEKATVQDYLSIANVRISEDALVKVNSRAAALDLTLRDSDSIEVFDDGDQSTGGIDTCTNRGNGFDPARSMHLFKEDYNGKKLLRYSRGDIVGNCP